MPGGSPFPTLGLSISREPAMHGVLTRMLLHQLLDDGFLQARRETGAEDSGQVVSQATYRAARGESLEPDEQYPPPHDARFVRLTSPFTPSELQLMTHVGDGWTARQIAEATGIKRDAAKKRVMRLRRRAQRLYPTLHA